MEFVGGAAAVFVGLGSGACWVGGIAPLIGGVCGDEVLLLERAEGAVNLTC